MNAQYIIDLADKFVVRQDFDRTVALRCLNSAMKECFRSFVQHKFMSYKNNVFPVDGFVRLPTLKNPEVVEYNMHNFNETGAKIILQKVISFDQILATFGSASLQDPYTIGVPEYYMIVTDGIQVFPTPPEGVVSVYGEFYPEELTDSVLSENNITREMPMALAYYTAAYYFELLTEIDKANYWREKASQDLQNFIFESKKQRTSNMEFFARDPWGNKGINLGLDAWRSARAPYNWHLQPPISRHHNLTLLKITTIYGGNWDNATYNTSAW